MGIRKMLRGWPTSLNLTKVKVVHNRQTNTYLLTGEFKATKESFHIVIPVESETGQEFSETFISQGMPEEYGSPINSTTSGTITVAGDLTGSENESMYQNQLLWCDIVLDTDLVDSGNDKYHFVSLYPEAKISLNMENLKELVPIGLTSNRDKPIHYFRPFGNEGKSNLLINGSGGSEKSLCLYSLVYLIQQNASDISIAFCNGTNKDNYSELLATGKKGKVFAGDFNTLSLLRSLKQDKSEKKHLVVIENFDGFVNYKALSKGYTTTEAKTYKAVREEILELILVLSKENANVSFIFSTVEANSDLFTPFLSTCGTILSFERKNTTSLEILSQEYLFGYIPKEVRELGGNGYVMDTLNGKNEVERVRSFRVPYTFFSNNPDDMKARNKRMGRE